MKPEWHFGSPTISVRAILISALALTVPVAASVTGGGEPGRFEALLWLSALIPGFLLAYYRGWSGVATGLAFAMFGFSVTQVYLIVASDRLPDWPYMLAITGALALGSLVAGAVTDRLHAERERAERLALIDPVTDLPNRRYFDVILGKEFAAAERGRDLVLVVFDVDDLQAIQDRHGREAGDDVLKAFADVLRSYTRSMNLSARLEAGEFISLVSASTIDGALVFVRRVQDVRVTVSAGVAAYHDGMSEPRDLLAAADRALSRARTEPAGLHVAERGSGGAPEP